jgi:hypothetical protein
MLSAACIAWKRRQHRKSRACEIGSGGAVPTGWGGAQDYSPVGGEKDAIAAREHNPVVEAGARVVGRGSVASDAALRGSV